MLLALIDGFGRRVGCARLAVRGEVITGKLRQHGFNIAAERRAVGRYMFVTAGLSRTLTWDCRNSTSTRP